MLSIFLSRILRRPSMCSREIQAPRRFISSRIQVPVLCRAASRPTSQEWGGVTWQATPAAALIAAVYHVNANNGGGNATIYTIGLARTT